MNVFIMTDMEGVSLIDSAEMIDRHGKDFNAARHLMMCDVNAAIEGAVRGGAKNIYTLAGHFDSFINDELDSRGKLLGMDEWEDVIRTGQVDVYMEVGAHAMAGTENAFLDHTQSSASWYNYKVNGRRFGEVEINAMFTGAFGVPLVMVSGDSAACREAQSFFGDIITAPVKTALCRNRANCLPHEEALERIRSGAEKAMSIKRPSFCLPLPLKLRLELYRSDMCDNVIERLGNKVNRIDARCVERTIHEITSYDELVFCN